MVKPTPLEADVIQVLEQWRPTKWAESDLRILEPLMPTIRGWVERMDLPDADHTRNFLLAASAIAVWALRSFGNADPTVVFHPSNVEAWSMTVRADKSLRWRQTTRSRLRALGRVINAEGWPPPTQQVSKHAVARPYATVDERVFRLVYALPGPANRSQRLWIVCGSLGAGLRGFEIAAAHTSDIENIGDGRLAVRVRGRNRRLVPIRTDYTDLARAATNASATRSVCTDECSQHRAHHRLKTRTPPVIAACTLNMASGPPIGRNIPGRAPQDRRASLRQHPRRATAATP